MEVVDLPVDSLREAPWNPNRMEGDMLVRLKESISRYGLVENMVVRPNGDGTYELLSGNQRLKVLREMGVKSAPCVIVKLNDAHSRLLAQALNRVQGEDDLGLRAQLVQDVLASMPKDEILKLLPETTESLNALASMGQEELATYLENWQQAQTARFRHLIFQLTQVQKDVVEEALGRLIPLAKQEPGESPNLRGIALYLLCKSYLEREGQL